MPIQKTLPFGSPPALIDRLSRELRRADDPDVQKRGPAAWLRTLHVDTTELLTALIDLRSVVEDFTPAVGFPRAAKGIYGDLLLQLLAISPESFDDLAVVIRDVLEHPAGPALDALAAVYSVDYRLPPCLRWREGKVQLDAERLRNMIVAQLSQLAEVGLLPPDTFHDFAELYVEHIALDAIDWYQKAFPRPIDPRAYAGFPTIERLEMLFEDGNLDHYRKYLGKQPPDDLVDTATSQLDRTRAEALGERLRQAGGKRWKAVGRIILERLTDPT